MALRLIAVHAHPDDESSKGAATYAHYLDQGAEVLIVSCTGGERGDVLNELVARDPKSRRDALRGWGLRAEIAPFDVTDADAVVAAIGALGRLDILIGNAGTTVRKPLREQTEDDWRKVIDTDLTACWRLSRSEPTVWQRWRAVAPWALSMVAAYPRVTWART